MNDFPSTQRGDGKDSRGRFAPGNRLGRGNPLAGKAARIRAELLRASKPKDVMEICRKLIDGAKAGDLGFIKEWFDRTAGRVTQPMEIAGDEGLFTIDLQALLITPAPAADDADTVLSLPPVNVHTSGKDDYE